MSPPSSPSPLSAASPLPVCLDVPDAVAPRYRYALDELLRGLGLRAADARLGDALLIVSADPPAHAGRLRFRVDPRSLAVPRRADVSALAWLDVEGERWPLPVGTGRPAADPAGVVEADVLGSAFWWLAGQEAATVERDRHGRFPYARSLQAALGASGEAPGGEAPGTALRPAVDAYRRWLGGALRPHVDVPGRTWGGAEWALALTHDVDALDAGRVRGLVGESLRGRPGAALRRALGPNRRRASLDALAGLARGHGVRSTVFVKAGSGAAEDVPYGLGGSTRAALRALCADGFEVGLHPSYAAADHPRRLAAERARLAAAVGTSPRVVRTHFLRWIDAVTPRLLADEGFGVDSSLGFSEAPGFRRGTAHPFRLYDLGADRVTDVWEMPLAVMDTTLFDHQGLQTSNASDASLRALRAARASGGVAVVLWHTLVGEPGAWGARTHVLRRVLESAVEAGAAVGPLGPLLASWRAG